MPYMSQVQVREVLETTRGTLPGGGPTNRLFVSELPKHGSKVPKVYPDVLAGYSPHRRGYAGDYPGDTLELTFDGADFELGLIWLGNLFMKALASGTGASADKTWAFAPSQTSDTLKSASIQWGYGDAISASIPGKQILGLLGDELSIEMGADKPLKATAKLLTHQLATDISALTGAGANTVGEAPLQSSFACYIDTASAIGSTAAIDVTTAKWTLQNKLFVRPGANGTATGVKVEKPSAYDWKLELSRYYADKTMRDAYTAGTVVKVRCKYTGTIIPTTAVAKTVTFDFYGMVDDYDQTDSNGLGFETLPIVPIFDSGTSGDFSMTVVCGTASIT